MFGLIPALFYGIIHVGVLSLLGAGAVFFGMAWWWPRFGRLPKRLLTGAVLAVGIFALVLSVIMARQAWFTPPPSNHSIPVIVLGGKVNGDRPSLMVARRLRTAAEYLTANPEAVCVVSGGQGTDEEYPEAVVMAAYLEELGIPPERIIQEAESANTLENLAFSREYLADVTEIAIATDGFHQLRASMIASSLGLRSYALSSGTPWGLLPSYWVREWVGVPVYWLRLRWQS